MAMKPITISATQLFAFNRATLTPQAKGILDSAIVAKLGQFSAIQFINVNGHADRIGSQMYNQRLSERRAEAVKAYLASKGVRESAMETYGFGKTQPVKHGCEQKNRQALIECLAPNRRVVVDVKGMPR